MEIIASILIPRCPETAINRVQFWEQTTAAATNSICLPKFDIRAFCPTSGTNISVSVASYFAPTSYESHRICISRVECIFRVVRGNNIKQFGTTRASPDLEICLCQQHVLLDKLKGMLLQMSVCNKEEVKSGDGILLAPHWLHMRSSCFYINIITSAPINRAVNGNSYVARTSTPSIT